MGNLRSSAFSSRGSVCPSSHRADSAAGPSPPPLSATALPPALPPSPTPTSSTLLPTPSLPAELSGEQLMDEAADLLRDTEQLFARHRAICEQWLHTLCQGMITQIAELQGVTAPELASEPQRLLKHLLNTAAAAGTAAAKVEMDSAPGGASLDIPSSLERRKAKRVDDGG